LFALFLVLKINTYQKYALKNNGAKLHPIILHIIKNPAIVRRAAMDNNVKHSLNPMLLDSYI